MIPEIHPRFKLNGRHLNHEGLMTVAYSYIKEGETWEKEIGDFLLSWLDDFECLTVYTSGSTGAPKEIKLKKQYMINSAMNTHDWFNLPKECDALCCLPLSYIAGKMMLVRAIALGWQIDVIQPSSTPLKPLRKRYDFTAMTNQQVVNSLDDIHKTVKVIIGGGPVASNLHVLLENKHTKAYHTYGMTETSTHVAIRKIHPINEEYFETLNGITISLDDRGCLIIHAPELSDDDVVTNDFAEILDDHHFKILGRVDRIINTGGVKVHPEKIEDHLSKLLPYRFFIASRKNEELGQEVILVIEGEQTKEWDLSSLDKFEKPKKIFYVPEFIETHTGKIDRLRTLALLNS
ncbi:MAG: AMP-binding protein [Nonlabens sp.]